MSIQEFLAEKFFGNVIAAKVEESLKAAVVTDDNEEGWTRLTGEKNTKNLDPLTQERMLKIAYYLWETNPMAKWLIRTISDFILAEGLPYEADDKKVKEALDDFWNDPINQMDLWMKQLVDELYLYGELCLPGFTAEQTGRLRLGYVDPANIKKRVTDPHNVRMIIGIELRDTTGHTGLKYKTILPEGAEEILSKEAQVIRQQHTDGECFFFAINHVTNSPEGRSELLPVADWLDGYEQFLYDYVEKWPLQGAFLWDLLVEGGTPAQIKEQLDNLSKKTGSAFGHNEKVTLNAVTPDLKAVEAEKGARLIRNHILSSLGWPEHWFGGGGDVNRATSVEMGTPAFKSLDSKQRTIKYILEFILGVVIDKRRVAGSLQVDDKAAKAFTINTPEIATKDLTKQSAAIKEIAASLTMAENQEWIDKEGAQKIFAMMMAYLGVEVDLETVKKNIDEEGVKDAHKDYLDKEEKPGE